MCTGLGSGLFLGLFLALTGCGRQAAREAASRPAPPPRPATSARKDWSWRPVGGLAILEGELASPAELVLEGRSIREARFAEAGPVRWELFRPPVGETALLRTASGQILARFEFVLPPPARVAPPKPSTRAASAIPPKARHADPPAQAQVSPVLPARAKVSPAILPARAEVGPAIVPARPPKALPGLPAVAPDRVTPLPSPTPFLLPRAAAPAPGAGPWPGMGEALNLTRGPGGQKRLLLSFDGGSNAEVATEILDALKARGVHTTIFLTGAFIQHFPALVKRMAAEGHELGNHTMNHPHFAPGMKRDPKWTKERVQGELLEADAALVRLLGRPMDPYWRAPYGEQTAEIRRWAEELGYRHVGWSEGADTLDWATPKERRLYRSGDAILQRLRQRLDRDGDGLIVLMHLGSERAEKDRPSAGLGAFMDRARREGWAFVPVSAFLHDLGKPAWNPQLRLAFLQSPTPAPQSR
ncbi:polysaccharide deacetylase family protein [Geothrix sp. SG200]|uniref:polysaccharide deacetylase family protein n=1 Tax=Geothrix sp. SG200 TaxID=2922865 RepID=UPI001FAB5CFC|nr:polysaccharide deacetylase family protein [Geothrix sp. SG200]